MKIIIFVSIFIFSVFQNLNSMETLPNYYRLLDLDPKATETEIEAALKKMTVIYDPAKDAGHAPMAKHLQNAKKMLLDRENRELYDYAYKRYAEHIKQEGLRAKAKPLLGDGIPRVDPTRSRVFKGLPEGTPSSWDGGALRPQNTPNTFSALDDVKPFDFKKLENFGENCGLGFAATVLGTLK